MKPLGVALVLVAFLGFFPQAPVIAADCQFVLGFQVIHDQIPDIVGECVVDQHYNPENGDALQETTKGLMVWRKADNFTAFTDGFRSWVNGPYGLMERLNTERFEWEKEVPTAPAAPTVSLTSTPATQAPAPTPTPTPTSVPQHPYFVVPTHAPAVVLPGFTGIIVMSARLSAPNAPPVFGATATFTYAGNQYTAITQSPDGSATVSLMITGRPPATCFTVTISHNGQTYTVPGWEMDGLCWATIR